MPLISQREEGPLDKGHNAHLFRITQMLSVWRFDIAHYLGMAMCYADTTLRYLILAEENDTGTAFLAARLAAMATSINKVAPSAYWTNCTALSASTAPAPSKCKELHRYRDKLGPRDGTLTYINRPVIPHRTRVQVWDVVHTAHQDRSSTLHRAAQTELQPGYTADVKEKMASSQICYANALTKQSPDRQSASQCDGQQSRDATPLASQSDGPESQPHRYEEEGAGLRTPASARQKRRAHEPPLPLDMTLETAGSTTAMMNATTTTISASHGFDRGRKGIVQTKLFRGEDRKHSPMQPKADVRRHRQPPHDGRTNNGNAPNRIATKTSPTPSRRRKDRANTFPRS